MTNHTILTQEDIASQLQNLPDWRAEDGELKAEFTFNTFTDAIAFINRVAEVAEEMQHHPEFCNAYNKVSFAFCTHDVGNKITDTDMQIAEKISRLAAQFQ